MAPGVAPRRAGLRSAEAQIEGRHPVLEALRASRPLRKLLVARGSTTDRAMRHLVGEARARGVPVQEVDPAVLAQQAQTRSPQGVIAYAAAHRVVEISDILGRAHVRSEAPFLLLLDGVQDPGNLGAIIRSADAAGVHGVVIPRHRAVGLTPTVAASSAGAVEHVPVAVVPNLGSAIEYLKREGIWVTGADPVARDPVYAVELTPPLALVLGGEGRGLSRLVRDRCDRLIRIPMHGATSSLNVSVAAGVLLFEVRRQMAARAREAR